MYSPLTAPSTPNRQLRSPVCSKCFPNTVTVCPSTPLSPLLGLTPSTVAPASYRNCFPSLVKSAPSLTLTSTSTRPATNDAVVTQPIIVDVINFTPLAPTVTWPNRHCKPVSRNPLPSTLTSVPPDTDPRVGLTADNTTVE
eukprot:3940464-Rhodomonas_salina.1